MKEAVLEHHLDVDLGDQREQIVEHHAAPGDPVVQAVDASPLDVLEHQHPAAGELRDHFGHDDTRVHGEVATQRLRVPCLLPEVELTPDALGELAHDGRDGAGVVIGKQ
jgi:hypothetical protein